MLNLLKSYYLRSIKSGKQKKTENCYRHRCFSAHYRRNKKFGEAVVVTPKNPNQLDYRYDYQIYRYKSWWVPSKEGYSIGWPFKDQLHQDIIDMNFDILHSHAPLATSYYFRRVVEKKKIPTVLTYHTKYEYDFDRRIPTKPARDFAYRFLLNNINAADEVWVTSKGTAIMLLCLTVATYLSPM